MIKHADESRHSLKTVDYRTMTLHSNRQTVPCSKGYTRLFAYTRT